VRLLVAEAEFEDKQRRGEHECDEVGRDDGYVVVKEAVNKPQAHAQGENGKHA